MFDSFTADGLSIEVTQPAEKPSAVFTWRGRSSARRPGELLDPYLNGVAEVAGEDSTPVEMHFEQLDYFNSSTISSLIRFIRATKDRDVPLTIVFDESVNWQKLSFDALRIFEDGQSVVLDGKGTLH